MHRTIALLAAIGCCGPLAGCGPDRELVASAVTHRCVMLAAGADLEEAPDDASAQARLDEARALYETVINGDAAIEEAAAKAIEDSGCPDDLPY